LPATLARQPWLQAGFSDGWPLVDAAEIIPLGWRRPLLSLGEVHAHELAGIGLAACDFFAPCLFAADKGGWVCCFCSICRSVGSRTKLTRCNSSLSASSAA